MRVRGVLLAATMTACGEAAMPVRYAPVDAPPHLAWPSEAAFQANAASWSARPFEVLHGTAELDPDPGVGRVETTLSVRVDARGEARIQQLNDWSDVDRLPKWCTEVTRGETWRFACEDLTLTVSVPGWAPAEPTTPEAAWQAWVYATTLLEPTGALYEPDETSVDVEAWTTALDAMDRGDASALDKLWAVVERSGTANAGRSWSRALDWVGDRDLALSLAIHRRYRPYMGCGMDRRPWEVERLYAERCYAAGDLECYLRLHAGALGRVPLRTLGGQPLPPGGVAALARAGVDVRRFLLGLLLDFEAVRADGRPVERMVVTEWSIAEAMESWNSPELERDVVALAEDPALDEYNRLRAAMALFHLWQRRFGQDAALTRLHALALSPATRASTVRP